MKKKISLLALLLSVYLNLFAQATTLTIDNQTPGWLSSKINYGDQLTLKNLKVTGYINGTDIKFIRELNLNRSLNGIIDLKDVNVVAGGEPYYDNYTTVDSCITSYMFASLKHIQKLELPKSVKGFAYRYGLNIGESDCVFSGASIDSLIFNCGVTKIPIGVFDYSSSHGNPCISYMSLPEGLEILGLKYFFSRYSYSTEVQRKEIVIPSTLQEVLEESICVPKNKKTIIRSKLMDPEPLLVAPQYYNPIISEQSDGTDTIYIPKGTMDVYQNKMGKKGWTIIEDISVDSVVFLSDIEELYVGDSMQLRVNVLPNNAVNKKLRWESAQENIVSVNDNGIVKANKFGETWIYAISAENKELYDSCKVVIYEHTTGVELCKTDTCVFIGNKIQLTAQTLPLYMTDNKVLWKSSDEAIAIVDELGYVIGLKQGTCVISAISLDGGLKAECILKVMQSITEINLYKHDLILKVGESEELRIEVLPVNADNKSVIWFSGNNEIASVNNNGKVFGLNAGRTMIYVKAKDNEIVCDSCEVTIIQPVTGITLSDTQIVFDNIGKTKTIIANVLPENATNKDVRWNSSDMSVCLVTDNGTLVALANGLSVVTATTVDGGFAAVCVVTVNDKSGIESIYVLDKKDYIIYDIKGNVLENLSKGVNIIKIKNGKTYKIVL